MQAVKCVDMYAEEIARELEEDPSGQTGSFNQEFNTPGYVWICPNTTQIALLNTNEPQINTYVSLEADVWQCQPAQIWDEQANFTSYADKDEKLTCMSADETAEQASSYSYSVTQKLMSMYFNPSDYHKYGGMIRTANYE